MAAKSKKDELVELTLEYKNKMAIEKLRRITLHNDTTEIELDKKKDTVCYKAIAIKEFEKAVESIHARIKNAPEQLTSLLSLNTKQAQLLDDYINDLLNDLANIDVQLDGTTAFDAENYFAGRARRSQMLNTD